MINESEIKFLAERTQAFFGKKLNVHVIANPVAGGFTIKEKVKANRLAVENALALMHDRPVLTKSCDTAIHFTSSKGHAGSLTINILNQALSNTDSESLYLIICAGGDGNSLEIQTEYAQFVLEKGHANLIQKVCFLRLPFGTGNDGADGKTLKESLELITNQTKISYQQAVKVRSSGINAHTWYAFNIASIGLDAFVTHMTNKLKHHFPGDSYKIWIDVACLFYNKIYKVQKMNIKLTSKNKSTEYTIQSKLLLFLMGVSGYRTYGSNQKILPDERNVCGAIEMPLLKKLNLKSKVKAGTHTQYPEILLYTADKAEIFYENTILLQLDGESYKLTSTDFPLTMELTEPFIPILKKI